RCKGSKPDRLFQAGVFLPDVGSIALSFSRPQIPGLMTRGSVDGEVSFSRSSGTAADRSDGNGAQASTILETAPALHLPKRPEDSKRRPLRCPGAPKPESAQNKNAKTPKCRNSQAGLGRMLRRTRLLRHREPRSGVAIQ